MRKPLIGIAANILIVTGDSMQGMYRSYVNHDYVESLERAGCVPVLLPVLADLSDVKRQMEGLDGIVLSGGYDIDPALYGEAPVWGQNFTLSEVDRFYLAVIRAAAALEKPLLGICKGLQAINVAFGGTLYQDLKAQFPGSIQHNQQAPRNNATHYITVEPDSFAGGVLPEHTYVNSYHHQAVKDLAEGFRVTARSDDGVIECIERIGDSFICGVQWHPEMMAKFGDPLMSKLFEGFVRRCEVSL